MRIITRNTMLATVLSIGISLLAGQGIAGASTTDTAGADRVGTDHVGNAVAGDGGDSGDSGNTGRNITINICLYAHCTIAVSSGDSGNTGQAGAGGDTANVHTRGARNATATAGAGDSELSTVPGRLVRRALQRAVEQQRLGVQCHPETSRDTVPHLPGKCQ